MRSLFSFLILLLTVLPSLAEFKFPPGVYQLAQLDEAMNAATKQKKPLYLVYGDETRDAALWVHWVIGVGLILLFPLHFFRGRRANYLALKHAKTFKKTQH